MMTIEWLEDGDIAKMTDLAERTTTMQAKYSGIRSLLLTCTGAITLDTIRSAADEHRTTREHVETVLGQMAGAGELQPIDVGYQVIDNPAQPPLFTDLRR